MRLSISLVFSVISVSEAWKIDRKCKCVLKNRDPSKCRGGKLRGLVETEEHDFRSELYNDIDIMDEGGLLADGFNDEEDASDQFEIVASFASEHDLPLNGTDTKDDNMESTAYDNEVSIFDERNLDELAGDTDGLMAIESKPYRSLQGSDCKRLKLWHKKGFSCWQDEWNERKWCMTQRGKKNLDVQKCPKRSTADVSKMKISTSGSGDNEWIQIKLNRRCLTYTGKKGSRVPGVEIELEKCNGNKNQLWRYNSEGAPDPKGTEPIFEINPQENPNCCVTQKHHPRKGEILFCQKCKTPKKSNHRTAWWTCDE
eukprot:scaffold317096_cov51-Attheya_sp.AAC.4